MRSALVKSAPERLERRNVVSEKVAFFKPGAGEIAIGELTLAAFYQRQIATFEIFIVKGHIVNGLAPQEAINH